MGSTKESYEPFFADVLSNPLTPPIHAIWAPDIANHGQSFQVNEDEIGDEHHWFDRAHDIMTKLGLRAPPASRSLAPAHFPRHRAHGTRAGDGISLEELKALGVPEQGLVRSTNIGFSVALMRDRWESREAAERHMPRSKYYSQFDPRVLAQTLRYEFRDMPDGSVKLATPRYQQAQLFMRAAPPMKGYPVREDYATRARESLIAPGFYRGEPAKIKEYLPGIHCKTLYVWTAEDKSMLSTESYRSRVVGKTGTGLGGAGGEGTGQVKEVFVAAEAHALPFLEPRGTAGVVATWLGEELKPS
ncbi:hypothetical protein RJZ56_005903 [Blastomyces dermatitidis]